MQSVPKRRRALTLGLLTLTAALLSTGIASAATNVSGSTPTTTTGTPLKCIVLAPVCAAGDAVKGAVSGAANSTFDEMTAWVANGATWLLGQFASLISQTTTVHLSADWFGTQYRQMTSIAAVLALGLLLLAVCAGTVTGNTARITRGVTRVATAGLATMASVGIVALLLEVSDALSTYVGGSSLSSLNTSLIAIGDQLTPASGGTPEFITLLACLGAVLIGLVLWIELLIRSVAIYTAVLFLPLALAGGGLGGSGRWLKRLAETLVALIFSKFVIIAIFSLAVGAVTSSGSFSTVIAGLALLLAAACSPWALMGLIHAAESGVGSAVMSARGRTTSVASGAAARIGSTGRLASFPSTSSGMTLTRPTASSGAMAGAAGGGALLAAGAAVGVASRVAHTPARHLESAASATSGNPSTSQAPQPEPGSRSSQPLPTPADSAEARPVQPPLPYAGAPDPGAEANARAELMRLALGATEGAPGTLPAPEGGSGL